jgi:hypothetical protein
MARLSKADRSHHRTWLAGWRTPAEMAAYVAKVADAMGEVDLFNQTASNSCAMPWLAAEFGRHQQSSFVRLVPERDRWPDFEARGGGGEIERVECAEADISDRRRGCGASSSGGGGPSWQWQYQVQLVVDWYAMLAVR